jgi:uncharacterized membrane protein
MAFIFFLISSLFWIIYYYYQFRSGELGLVDFSILDWMLKNSCEGRLFQVPIPDSQAIFYNHFSIHFTPIVTFLLPFKCFFTAPFSMSIFQALIFSSSFFFLNKILEHLRFNKMQLLIGNISFLLFPYCYEVMSFNFHFEVFYIPLGFLILLLYLKGRVRSMIATVFFYLMIKEDAAFYMTPFLLSVYFMKIRDKRLLVASMYSVFYFCTSIFFIAMFANSQFDFFQLIFSDNVLPIHKFFAYEDIQDLRAPFLQLYDNFVPLCIILIKGVFSFFSYFLFLPLFVKVLLFPMLSFVLIHALSSSDTMNQYELYYSSPLLPFAFVSFFISVSRLKKIPFIKSMCLLVPIIGALFYYATTGLSLPFSGATNIATFANKINEALLENDLKNEIICVSGRFWPYLSEEFLGDPLDQYCLEKKELAYIFHEDEVSNYELDISTLTRYNATPFVLFYHKDFLKQKKSFLFWNFFSNGKQRHFFHSDSNVEQVITLGMRSKHPAQECNSFTITSTYSASELFRICAGKVRTYIKYRIKTKNGENWIEINFLDKHKKGDLFVDYVIFEDSTEF